MLVIPVRLYEGLFLLSQSAAGDLAGAVEHVKGVLTRAEAEILVLRKWEERKLAYPIKGQKRGTYLLAYFKARATQIANIDRDCNLSEQILRALIVQADHIGETELELAKREVPAAAEAALRSAGDKPAGERPASEKAPAAPPAAAGPALRSAGDKPASERPASEKAPAAAPAALRPVGDKPAGERPAAEKAPAAPPAEPVDAPARDKDKAPAEA